MLPGQIGFSVPPGEDAIIRRIADLERVVRELGPSVAASFNTTVAGLTAAVAQLNAASESKSAFLYFTPTGTPDSQAARTNYDSVIVTFTKPTWATKGTVLAFSTFSGSDSATAGFTVSAWTRIFAVDGAATSILVPNALEIRSGGTPTGAYAYDRTPAPTSLPFTQSFVMGAAAAVSASLRLTKGASGGNSSFACGIAATVFWSAG